jgi:transcription elongation factor Elf1
VSDTRKFNCPTCNTVIVGRAKMTLHKATHMVKTCRFCDTEITGKVAYRIHTQGCRVVVRAALRARRDALTNVILLDGDPTPDDDDWHCGDCDEVFKNEAARQSHLRQNMHRPPPRYTCKDCDFGPVHTATEIKAHKKETQHEAVVPRDWMCGECGKQFPTIEQRRSHGVDFLHDVTMQRLRTDRDPETQMACKCGRATFTSTKTLLHHMKRKLEPVCATTIVERPVFKCGHPGCNFVGKTFKDRETHFIRTAPTPTRRNAMRHSAVVDPPMFFCQTQDCQYWAHNAHARDTHVLQYGHKGMSDEAKTERKQPYLCAHAGCGLRFGNFRTRRKHYRATHTPKPPADLTVTCSCLKIIKASSPTRLRKNLIWHIKKYKCPPPASAFIFKCGTAGCPLRFATQQALSAHVESTQHSRPRTTLPTAAPPAAPTPPLDDDVDETVEHLARCPHHVMVAERALIGVQRTMNVEQTAHLALVAIDAIAKIRVKEETVDPTQSKRPHRQGGRDDVATSRKIVLGPLLYDILVTQRDEPDA